MNAASPNALGRARYHNAKTYGAAFYEPFPVATLSPQTRPICHCDDSSEDARQPAYSRSPWTSFTVTPP